MSSLAVTIISCEAVFYQCEILANASPTVDLEHLLNALVEIDVVYLTQVTVRQRKAFDLVVRCEELRSQLASVTGCIASDFQCEFLQSALVRCLCVA